MAIVKNTFNASTRNDGKEQYHTFGLNQSGALEKTCGVGSILTSNDKTYLYDGNGNIVAFLSDDGSIRTLIYDPFGKLLKNENIPFSFCSKSQDQSGMTYYGFRFFDPSTARWNKADPISYMK